MKNAVIWDLDGTLLDSYHVIVESIYLTSLEFGVSIPKEEIHKHTIQYSTKSLFREISEIYAIPVEMLQRRYSQISSGKFKEIRVMAHGIDILEVLTANNVDNYVFTHRGRTTIPVLDHLKMTHYFKDILTSQSGFARKPDPEGLEYLIDRYSLERCHTWYVGDRAIDMQCAKNAGISGILYLPANAIDVSGGAETVIVTDLLDIASVI